MLRALYFNTSARYMSILFPAYICKNENDARVIMSKKRTIFILLAASSLLLLSVLLLKPVSRSENKKFKGYTAELFCQEVSSNTISLHYTLKDPASYGIENVPVSLGTVSTDTDSMCASVENALALLHSYDRGRLSRENGLTYDILEHHLNNLLKEAPYALYEEPLSPLTGTQSQLPVLLSEYRFYSADDCRDYLTLLTQIPEYFRSIIEFEYAKSNAGLFMASYNAEKLIEECRTFMQMGENNYLYSSFEERLKELDLPESEKTRLTEQNRNNIKDCVFPAYQELIDAVTELKDTGKNSCGLCYLPKGTEYYELTVKGQTGSSRTIPELRTLTLSQMSEDAAKVQEVLASISENGSGTSGIIDADTSLIPGSDPEKILTSLRKGLDNAFPESPNADVQIKYVQKSMEDYLSPAFYMIPAIDDAENNVIYINEGRMPDNLTLFTTLAHEGYPGHLYQTTYYAATDPDPLRSLLSFGGYTEGWATYSEMMSYYLAPLSDEQAALMQHNSSVILGLYALADMGIHYDGWTLLDTVAFFRDYGITDTGTIEEIYNLIIGDPGNYLKYYIGYVEFLELKKEAIKKWGDGFSQERFHKAVLETGPAPFDILKEYVLGTG